MNILRFLFIMLIIEMCYNSNTIAQNFGNCGFNEITEEDYLKTTNCSNTSNTWINQYRVPSGWIPDDNTPVKTILVNWIICQNSNGLNGWQDTLQFRNQVNLMFDKVNEIYSDIQPKGYSLTCEPTINYITDTKIRFELNDIIFIQEDTFNDASIGNSILSWLYSHYPDTKNQLNHIFTMPSNGPSYWGRYAHYNNFPYVITHYSMYSDWYVVWDDHINHIAHEYGHAVGLHHTYNSEPINITHYDFLDDVFGLCGEISCCFPPPNEVCYLTNPCFWDNATPPLVIMNNTTEQRYISPKQSGRMHRSLSLYDNIFVVNNKNMHRYVKEITPYHVPMEITQSETWDFKIKMYQDIIVKSGNTLTIKCEVMMPNNGNIIVEQGAKLIIDGGKVTNFYYLDKDRINFWQGIQVYGTTDKNQYPIDNPTYQGLLVIQNGGIIEHAHKAVTNWKQNSWNEIGGVIQVTDGIFRNNRRDVEFMAYQNYTQNYSSKYKNFSFFRNTDFISDDDFIENGLPVQTHVTLWEVDGINFTNCHFANNVTNTNNSSSPDRGIYSIDAGYKVLAGCSTTPPLGSACPAANVLKSSFKGLKTAIEMSGSATTETVTVQQAVFEDNVWGIKVDDFDNVSLNRNIIDVGGAAYPPLYWPIGVGMVISNSTGFIIEENDISNYLTAKFQHGIIVSNSGNDDNRIYKNKFSDLNVGGYAQGLNRDVTIQKGLQFLCNDFDNNNIAIAIGDQIHPDGIRIYQGEFSPKKSARNTFDNNTLDIDNNANSIVYFHHGGNSIPVNFEGLVTLQDTTFIPTCPTSFGGGVVVGPIFPFSLILDSLGNKLDDYTTAYNDLDYSYYSLLDDGNTEEFKENIDLNWSADAWLLRDKLIATSPYLSTDALLEAASQSVLPNGMLLEVLLANPDATRGEDFIEKLKEVTHHTFPEYMLDYVRGNYDSKTLRTVLEGQMSSVHSDLSSTRNWIKHFTKSKEEYTDSDRLEVAKMGDEVFNKVGLMDFYIEQGAFTKADSVLHSLENDRKYAEYLHLIENFRNYIAFRSNLVNNNRNLAQLESKEIEDLKFLAETKGRVAGYAQNILCFFYDICYEKDLAYIPQGNTRSLTIQKNNKEEINDILYNVKLYPNPADDYTSIQWEIYDELKDARWSVVDLSGRELLNGSLSNNKGEQVIDTRQLGQGIYIINIYNNGQMKADRKLVVEER